MYIFLPFTHTPAGCRDAASSSPHKAGGSADGVTASAAPASGNGRRDTEAHTAAPAAGSGIDGASGASATHDEPTITIVPDGRATSDTSRSHQGSGLASAASAHHPQGVDPAPTADPHRGTRAGSSSASHSSVMPPPAADDATMPTVSAAATLADSSSPDVTVDTADGATATATSAADTGMDVDMGPVPPVIAPTPPNMDTEGKPKKKRRRSHGPGREASRNLFYASERSEAANGPESQGGADARGADRGGA